MKNRLFLFLLLLLFTGVSQAQWQPDVRLTNDTAWSWTSINNAWCIASSGDFVHVVWSDERDGNFEEYYKRSTDGGVSWGADTRLTNNPAGSFWSSVAATGSIVHVVWMDNRDGNLEIYYKRSANGGIGWQADSRLTNNTAQSWNPSVSVSGSVVHVVWMDIRDGNWEIYYKQSIDGGLSWGTDTRLTSNSAGSTGPSVTVSAQVVHVAWFDDRDGNSEIYYKRSTDGGMNWGADTRLTNNFAASESPSISVSGQAAHIVWSDDRNGSWDSEIYYKRSTDGGMNWGADTRLTNNFNPSESPSISVSGQAVHVVWMDQRDQTDEIYYKHSTDGGISWEADTRLTNDFYESWYPSISISGQVVHVVWMDNRDGNYEIYYKCDPTGNPIGINIISSQIPKDFSLSQNYPNPFNPVTKIRFDLPKPNFVTLTIYDVLGREVATLVNEQLQPGTYEAEWNATNYTSGVYFYKLITESFSESKRMVLIK